MHLQNLICEFWVGWRAPFFRNNRSFFNESRTDGKPNSFFLYRKMVFSNIFKICILNSKIQSLVFADQYLMPAPISHLFEVVELLVVDVIVDNKITDLLLDIYDFRTP